MSFLDPHQLSEITKKLTSDPSQLGKIYRAKKNLHQTKSVDRSLVDDYLDKGWEVDKELKTKTKLIKRKKHFHEFEDEVWCQFYELGYRYLNFDNTFVLPFSKDKKDTKQIDIIAIDDDTVFIIECKSSEKSKKAPSYKDEFDLLRLKLDGFKKAIEQVLNKKIRIKYIFATKNLRMGEDSDDLKRLRKTRSFYYNEDTYLYVQNLLKHYKNAARYQFLGLVFKNEKINDTRIEIPAIEGDMGGKKYYMFSIEPKLLLKISFILHKAKFNNSELPSYQRLLNPKKRQTIGKFINDGGYFPNSIIINFSRENKKHKLEFKQSLNTRDSQSKHGVLYIPNTYAIAYIIDGQHRLYGYAGLSYASTNTVPVVAFDNLDRTEQLKIFMDINEKQTKVSKSLIIALDEDMLWDDDFASNRLKALRSSIASELADGDGPLSGLINIGEERGRQGINISGDFIVRSLERSELLPKTKGGKSNIYDNNTIVASIYNTANHDHQKEMIRTKGEIVKLINLCYQFVYKNFHSLFIKREYFIVSSRGIYAFILLIGRLNAHLINLTVQSSAKERFEAILPYLRVLLNTLNSDTELENEKQEQLTIQGATADKSWIVFLESIVNTQFPDFKPKDLIDWQERKNDDLQETGRTYGVSIERHIKETIIKTLKALYGNNWDLDIGNNIKTECSKRANEEIQRIYQETKDRPKIEWTEMFNITDYKTIISKHWAKSENLKESNLQSFQQVFAIDLGDGIKGKANAIKWISKFNGYRNLWAHEGTKEKRLNKEEVRFLEKIHNHFKLGE